jgi:hypothetical protein
VAALYESLNLAPSRRRQETFLEEQKIELAPQLAPGLLVDRRIKKLADVVDFLTHLHFNRETSRVSQDLERQPKILGHAAVLIEVQGLAFAGQVIELPRFLCSTYALFCDQVNVVHEWIVSAADEVEDRPSPRITRIRKYGLAIVSAAIPHNPQLV